MFRVTIIGILLLALYFSAKAQDNALSANITFKADSATLGDVLTRLSSEFSISFFYSPSKIPLDKRVSINVEKVPLQALLEILCRKTDIGYKIEGSQVILTPSGKIKTEGLYTISGFVSDSITGERLIGANIIIRNLSEGTVTNAFGFYSFTLPKGPFKLKCSFIGYHTIEATVDVSANQKLIFNLVPEVILLKEISLNAALKNRRNTAKPGQDELPLTLMRKSPALLGENDIVQYLKMLPGVQSCSDGPYGLYVRGSTPQQTSFVLDDAPMFNMYHISGWFSTINPDAIKDVQIYKSHFSAKTGGSVSSIVDIRLRDGNNQKFAVTGGLGTITSRITIEGPIVRDKASFIVSARRSYIDQLLKLFRLPEETGLENIYFYDLNAKLNYSLNTSNRIYLSVYTGKDIVNDLNGITWGNTLLSFRWNKIFSGRLFSNLTLIVSNYKHAFSGVDYSDRTYSLSTVIRHFALKYDFTLYTKSNNKINFGIASNYQKMIPVKYDYSYSPQLIAVDTAKTSQRLIYTVYSETDIRLTRHLNMNAGIRMTLAHNIAPGSPSFMINPEPLLSLRYNILQNVWAKAGYSRNYQYHHGARIFDIVIPFERFIFADKTLKPQHADHFSSGLFYNPGKKNIELSVEGYLSHMNNQYRFIANNELLLGQGYQEFAIPGKTKAYGVECSARKTAGRFTGMINYTWSRVIKTETTINDGRQYNPYYDRQHNIAVNTAFELSKRINLSATWIYMTGNPYNLPIAKYELNGRTIPLFDAENIYNRHMPNYHRLDLGVQFILGKGKHLKHSISIMLYNAYAKRNPIFYSYRDIVSGDPGKSLTNSAYTERQFSMLGYYVFQFVPAFSYEFKFD